MGKKERSFEKISLLPANEDDGQIDINNGFYEPQYTVNECLEYIGFGWFQVKLTVVLGFSWMADAIAITSLAVLAPALQCDWNLSPEQTALISTCVFIGMFFGAGFWGWFCDTFGRKLALTLSASLILVSFLCSSFAINYNFVLIFMIMEGFSVAGAGQSFSLCWVMCYQDLLQSL
ncbi:putative transporter svop-1 [Clytia hemisphaerica]|uniref:Major facilitator superfamily (MFS) profile domain-containing protein n=1 Tax=Clytia hemisphaerica TaxID=252671 RepID=A0A7M5UZN5_9CNID